MSAMPSFWRAPSQRESSVHFGAYEPRAPVAFRADLSKREEARRDTVAGDCWPAGILQLTFFQLNVHGGGEVQQAPYIQDRAANLAERPQRLP